MSACGSAPLTARITSTDDLINTNTVGHVIGDTRGRACPHVPSDRRFSPSPTRAVSALSRSRHSSYWISPTTMRCRSAAHPRSPLDIRLPRLPRAHVEQGRPATRLPRPYRLDPAVGCSPLEITGLTTQRWRVRRFVPSHRVPTVPLRCTHGPPPKPGDDYNFGYSSQHDEGPSHQERAYAVRQFVVAGGGFEPPTSGLWAGRPTSHTSHCRHYPSGDARETAHGAEIRLTCRSGYRRSWSRFWSRPPAGRQPVRRNLVAGT